MRGSQAPVLEKVDLLMAEISISSTMPDVDQRQKLMPFVGKYIQATGTIYYERNGTRAIVINDIHELNGNWVKRLLTTSAGGWIAAKTPFGLCASLLNVSRHVIIKSDL